MKLKLTRKREIIRLFLAGFGVAHLCGEFNQHAGGKLHHPACQHGAIQHVIRDYMNDKFSVPRRRKKA